MTATAPPEPAKKALPNPRQVFPFRLSPAGIAAVQADAKAEGITASEWIRRAVQERHERQQQAPVSDRAKTRR